MVSKMINVWRMKSKLKSAIWVMIIGISQMIGAEITNANAIDKLVRFANQNGTMTNVNKAGVVNDQLGGYLTGGSIIMRGPQPQTLQPLVVQTPKLSFDACSGSADFRFGGLSYVTAAEFTKFFKATASASGAYAVKMLIKTACPQCEDIMSYLETVARDVNGLMVNQCSAAQAIVGGIYGKLTSGDQQKCMMQGNMQGSNRDMYESTDKCKINPDRHGAVGANDELKSLLGHEFNLVWQAISLGANAGSDKEFKELIMSVSGTIIGKKTDGKYHFSAKPSLILSNDLLEQYLGVANGDARIKVYRCNNDKCLEPAETELRLAQNQTLKGNITRILAGLVTKVAANQGERITDEEEAVIQFSSIPLINLIELELVSKAKSADALVRMDEFVDVVCYDVTTNFLSQMVDKAQNAVEALEYAQIVDMQPIRDFTANADRVRGFLRDAKFAAFKRLQIVSQVKARIAMQEKAFEHGFSLMMQQIK